MSANASNNVAMWLGSLASTGQFRSELDIPRRTLVRMLVASTAGSVIGALLLLRTPNATFSGLIPFLLLGATVLFIAGPTITKASRGSSRALTLDSPLGLAAQTLIAMYGGFFGAAIGILMLALLGLLGIQDLRRANAFKVLLAALINGVAAIPFIIAKVIAWEPALFMSAGAIAGGIAGAGLVKRLPAGVLRNFVIVVACTMTIYFFYTTYVSK